MSAAGERRGLMVYLLLIFLLALSVRLYPLVWSPYPYNIDGLAEASFAGDISESGSLQAAAGASYGGSYIVDMPSLNALIALFSALTGMPPMMLAQLFVASIGALSCALAALVVHRISRSLRASVLSGMLLALLGTYVFCTSSVWKEALGLTVMVMIVGLLLERRDIRMRALMMVALVMMTFIHHHSAVITYLMLSFAVSGDAYLARRSGAWSWQNWADLGAVALVWGLAEAYYYRIELPYYEFLAPDQDLYLLVAVSGAMLMLMFLALGRDARGRVRPYLKLLIPGAGMLLLTMNFVRPVFPGIPGTDPAVLLFAGAYLLLVVPAWSGAESMLRSRDSWRPVVLALMFAPLTMILFAFLRGLDPTSYTVMYRSFDFLDLGLAALFGMGLVVLVRRLGRSVPALAALFIAALVLTTPIAFQTESLFGVHNHTYQYEVESLEVMHSMSSEKTLVSDQRLGTSSRSMFNFSGGHDLAIRIDTGLSVKDYSWQVTKSSWTTVGAQQFPFGQKVLAEEQLQQFLEQQNLLLVSGPRDNQLIASTNPPI